MNFFHVKRATATTRKTIGSERAISTTRTTNRLEKERERDRYAVIRFMNKKAFVSQYPMHAWIYQQFDMKRTAFAF